MYNLLIEDQKIPCYFFYDKALGFYLITETLGKISLKEKHYSLIINNNEISLIKGEDFKLYKLNSGNNRIYVFCCKDMLFDVNYFNLDSVKANLVLNLLSNICALPTGNYVIGSVQDYITVIEQIINSIEDKEFFFRGHYDYNYDLIPSIYRKKNYRENENFMYMDFKTKFYNELADKKYIEILTTMQHYKLPTRLLDTTSNPLVALFMACDKPASEYKSDIGEVVIMCENHKDVKYSDSNAITILSSLAVLETEYKQEIYEKVQEAILKNNPNIYKNSIAFKRFVAEVKTELPLFDFDFFSPEVLFKPRHVKVGMINERIIAQSGSFILFGLYDYVNNNFMNLDTIHKNRVFVVNKEKIIKQLAMLNIDSSTMYPDMDHMSMSITKNYN